MDDSAVSEIIMGVCFVSRTGVNTHDATQSRLQSLPNLRRRQIPGRPSFAAVRVGLARTSDPRAPRGQERGGPLALPRQAM